MIGFTPDSVIGFTGIRTLDRLPKRLSTRWEAGRERFESSLREASEVPDEAVTVAVSLDGVMVPMKDGGRAAKRECSRQTGRRPTGPAGYQEAGCATLSFYDAEGERLDTRYLGRIGAVAVADDDGVEEGLGEQFVRPFGAARTSASTRMSAPV